MVALIELYKIGILVFLVCILTTSSQASIVAVHPQNATVVNGGDNVLNCKFNEIIDKCLWIRNDSTIKINDRYKYYNSSMINGTKTDDCSIEISNFSYIDATQWHCTCTGDSNPNTTKYEQCKSNFAYLSMNTSDETAEEETNATLSDLLISNTATVVDHPENATVFEGSMIVLKCKFNKTIKCVWFRNATAVKIEGRYRYLNSAINGEERIDCFIKIVEVQQIDATHWQCACSVGSDLPNATCKSNFAYLTLNKSNANKKSTKTAKESGFIGISKFEVPRETIIGFAMTDFLLFIVIGLLLVAILLSTIVYFVRRNKAKRRQNLKSSVALAELPSNIVRHESSPNMNQSTESVCTLCHQHKPEPCSSGGVWSAPYYECRDKFLPLPEVTEQLPSYEEANLRHDENLDKLYEEMPIRESIGHYMYIDEFKQQEPENSPTMTNSSWSTEVNPLYDEVPTHETSETEADDVSNEIVRFEMGCEDVLYTRVQPKTKSKDKPTN